MRANRLGRIVRGLALVVAILAASASIASAIAPKVTAFAPASGTIGTLVTITGTGFTGVQSVTFNGAPAVTVKVLSATTLTAIAPTNVSTGIIAVKTAGGSGLSTITFTVTPGGQLSQILGHPGITLTVSGAGFSPYKPVDVYFDTTDTALAVTTARGLLSINVPVSLSAQPGTHWVSLIERGTNLAAQKPFTVNTDWITSGFNQAGRGFNPYENTVDATNVGKLTESWMQHILGLSNYAPFVVAGGSVFAADINGGVHALSNTGTPLWKATIGSTLPAKAPATFNGTVFFADNAGMVYAFKTACRTDGGVCAPIWKKSVGTAVTAGLTFSNGKLYVPSSDNAVHLLDPATGAEATPIYAFDKTHGTISTPVSVAADGSFFYGAGTTLSYSLANISSGYLGAGNPISPIALLGRVAFYTVLSGNLYEFGGANWNVAIPGGGCGAAPAIANNIVYAGGCSGVGAYNVVDGSTVWTTSTGGVSGLAVANGVVYACQNQVLSAYAATYGGKLWSIGSCSGAPEIVNGTVYQSSDEVSAFNLPGTVPDKTTAVRPAPRSLKPNYGLRKQLYQPVSSAAAAE